MKQNSITINAATWLAVLVVVLCGCAGTPYKNSTLATVQRGMTREQVRQIMGKPSTTVAYSGGTEKWVWAFGTPFGAKAASIVLVNGIVTDVPPLP